MSVIRRRDDRPTTEIRSIRDCRRFQDHSAPIILPNRFWQNDEGRMMRQRIGLPRSPVASANTASDSVSARILVSTTSRSRLVLKQARSWGRFSTCPAIPEAFSNSYFTRNEIRFCAGQVENLPHVDVITCLRSSERVRLLHKIPITKTQCPKNVQVSNPKAAPFYETDPRPRLPVSSLVLEVSASAFNNIDALVM